VQKGISIPEATVALTVAFIMGIVVALAIPKAQLVNEAKKQDRLMVTSYPANW